jgi:very-short-patch-repair endonuclease
VSKKLTTLEFIDKSNFIHNFKYDYSLSVYKNNKSKIDIICKEHGIFSQRPDSHLRGVECLLCGLEKFKKTQRKNITKIVDDFNNFHNYKYDYCLMKYKNAHTKILIICKKCNFIFSQTPNTHLRCGCPNCKESKGEKTINNFLIKNNILYERQKKFDKCIYKSKLFFDFYLPEYNICIEYDGLQHFDIINYFGGEKNFKLMKIRDRIKNDYCKKNNIKLIRIKYNENIDEKLFFLKNNNIS